MDINVTGVWERNVTGRGVTVAIVDDGLEWTNQDIRDNYCKEGSWDLNDHDADPTPSNKKDSNHHGTRCAGEIAAVKNSYCAVGVAYRANISGIKVLDGPMTDSLEAEAFNKNLQMNDIYSCSWGPDDDGKTVDGPHIMALTAMRYGIDFGRGGYGSIYVVASGNGGRKSDNCNYDGYANSIYTVTIGAVDETGHMPFYAEECASMLAVTYSSGTSNLRSIATTDWTQRGASGCTVSHTGTSAAAPIAAGMIALMLQVRPCLTWRDVQYLIAMTAQKVDIDEAHWQRNGAGLYHSHKHGFGLMRAWRLVNAAKVWDTVPWMTSYLYDSGDLNMQITKGQHNPLKLKYEVTESRIHGYDLFALEQMLVTVTIDHPCRGQLGVVLICPSGTRSVIGSPRSLDRSTKGFDGWTFNTVRCWGESPIGNWTLIIRDIDQMKYGPGFLKNWKLKLYGTPLTPEQFQIRKRRIEDSMSGQYLNDSFNLPCPEPPVTAKPDENMSQKTLKFIVLTGCFCLLVALYETFEYAACYREEKKAERSRMMEELVSRMSSQNASGVTMETDSIAQDTHRYLNTSDGRGEYIQLRDMSSADADLAGNSMKSNSEENIYQASSASDVIGHDTSSTQVIAHVQSDHSNRSVINVNESFTSPGENRNPLPPSRHSIYDNLVSNVTQGANSDQPSVPNGALYMSRDSRSTLSSLDDDDDEKRTLLSSSSK
ncbi:hypothetical protein FSP39_016971 [Pinctada imbricata]|uniref:P/Homo B domain-containing protein n=1 Tax=Pinctada imbricata TaxID=66713 RepID=A0AA88YW25_PINIB|nr:hypothetical protein FSP39_016971 [Pinctada imbricata]